MWTQLTMVIDRSEVERVSAMLESFLAQAITTENAGDDEFYEVAFPGTPDWQKVAVTGLFDAAVDLEPVLEFVQSQLAVNGHGEVPASISRLADQDWERVWLQSFKPIQVGDKLWVCPSWCEPVDPSARNIILDPGLAFGTGTHATTHLCLNWLAQQNLSGQSVLDYGSGSGILAIASLLAGADCADAVDIDPQAVQACKENARRNGVENRLHSCQPEQLPERQYPLVIANILAEVIIELRDTLLLHLASGGTLLLTGILDSQADRVIQAYSDGIGFQRFQQEQWCLLVGTSSR